MVEERGAQKRAEERIASQALRAYFLRHFPFHHNAPIPANSISFIPISVSAGSHQHLSSSSHFFTAEQKRINHTTTTITTMFFFFVGGVNQKIKKVIQQGYGPCVSCRAGTMDLVEMAKTLSVFFVPVWDFDRQTALVCRRCGFTCPVSDYDALQKDTTVQSFPVGTSCRHCGSSISKQWKFCPTCGGVAADYQGK